LRYPFQHRRGDNGETDTDDAIKGDSSYSKVKLRLMFEIIEYGEFQNRLGMNKRRHANNSYHIPRGALMNYLLSHQNIGINGKNTENT